jgi:hypothetical protein
MRDKPSHVFSTAAVLFAYSAGALLCHAADASSSRKLLRVADAAQRIASSSSSRRQLQQTQTNALHILASGQETAAAVSRAAESGQMMAILGAATAGNELARLSSDRSTDLSVFDKSSRGTKTIEKQTGRLMRP